MAVAQPALPTEGDLYTVIPPFLGRGCLVAVLGVPSLRPLDLHDGFVSPTWLEVGSRTGNNAYGGESFSLATLFPTRELLDRKAERECRRSRECAVVSLTEWGSIA